MGATSVLQRLPNHLATQVVVADNGCWRYTGRTSKLGYADARVDGRWQGLHRFVFEVANGRPAAGVVDHTCHNSDPDCAGGATCHHRACLNPAHLEDVPSGVNVLRGKSLAAANAAKTHCPRGHEYTAENTYVWPSGKRRCQTCHRTTEAAARAAGRRAS